MNNKYWFDSKFKIEKNKSFQNDIAKNSISLPNNINSLKIRQWKNGDKIVSSNDGSLRKVSNLFINSKLDFVEKRIMPIVVNHSDKIIWIPGISHSQLDNTKDCTKISWISNAK